MLVVEQYLRTGFLVYLWSKYLWQQMLEKRQRNILNAYKIAPAELRGIIEEEEYENRRNAALHRTGFEIFRGTVDVGLATTFILFEGFRKIWDKSSEIVAYLNIRDSNEIIKNALFLAIMTSGTFLASLPFSMLEIYVRQSRDSEKRATVTSVLLDHCVAQTLLFPFVCLFVVAFKLGGDKTMIWVLGFAEFQLLNELLDVEPVEPLQDGDLRDELVKLTEKWKFPLEDVFVTQRTGRQKFVTLGGFPTAGKIVISKELTVGDFFNGQRSFTDEEISALVARELSHWSRGHPYIHFFANQTHLCLHLYTIHRFLNSERMYGAFDFDNKPLAVGLTLLQFCPFFDLNNFVARIINRRLEFAADRDVKKIHGDVSLKSAIIKMANNGKSFPIQDSLYSACLSSEASCYERINALNEYGPS